MTLTYETSLLQDTTIGSKLLFLARLASSLLEPPLCNSLTDDNDNDDNDKKAQNQKNQKSPHRQNSQ